MQSDTGNVDMALDFQIISQFRYWRGRVLLYMYWRQVVFGDRFIYTEM